MEFYPFKNKIYKCLQKKDKILESQIAVIKSKEKHISVFAFFVGKVKWSSFPKNTSVQITPFRVMGDMDRNLLSQGQV